MKVLTLSLAALIAACGTSETTGDDDGGGGDPGGSGSGSGGGAAAKCIPGPTALVPGHGQTFSSTPGGTANRQRDYCFVRPAGATDVQLKMAGGTCNNDCIGGDVHLVLQRDTVPDAFDPDSSAKQWTFTPGGTATFMTTPGSGATGAWYLSLVDDANTLGYTGVTLTLM